MNIELYILGGLGNQLYQYAAARCIQEMYGYDKLVIITNSYRTHKLRKLEIGNFVLNDKTSFSENISRSKNIVRAMYHVFQKLSRSFFNKDIGMIDFRMGRSQFILSSTEYRNPRFKKQLDAFMYGYFVSSQIATKMRPILMNEIVLSGSKTEKYEQYLSKIKGSRSIGVSIRCGFDYVKYSWPICSKEFYLSGIEKIEQEIGPCSIFVFADDMERVKNEKWFDREVTYVTELDVCESFELLRYCNHYVCSNSSFSWWGAFLSYSENVINYQPNRVFSIKHEKDDEKTRLNDAKYLDYLTGEPVELN